MPTANAILGLMMAGITVNKDIEESVEKANSELLTTEQKKSRGMPPLVSKELAGLFVIKEVNTRNFLKFIVIAARVVPDWNESAEPLDVLIARTGGSTLVDLPYEKLLGKRIGLTKVTFGENCLYLARE